MKKNPLFYERTNANKHKIHRAWKILSLSMFLIFSIATITVASVRNHEMTLSELAKCATGGCASLAILPLVAGVKGTMEKNGIDETDDQFAARKGDEAPEVFHARTINYLEAKIKAVEKISADIPELKTYQEQLQELKSTLETMKKDSNLLANLTKEIENANLAIEGMKERGKLSGPRATMKAQINKAIEDNAEKIKQVFKAGAGQVELKVVAVVTTESASNPDGIPEIAGVQMAPPSNVNLRAAIIDSLVTTIPTSLPAYPYTDTLPKDGDFAFVAEGAAKDQIDFEMETRYATPVKVAAWVKLTEEAVNDIPNMQAIANDFLRKKHDLKRQNGILFGNGTPPNPTGATVYGRTFTADGLANAVTAPNFMDVVNAAITDIFTTHNYTDEMPYQANLVLVNPVDFFINLVSAKDTQGHPLFPTASLFNRVVIGGVTIIPEESIPAGKIFVADMSKYNITNWMGYTVKIGWVNDDFIKNQFVILAESRFHAFVKELDQQAFIYDDIATIKAAIEAP